MVDTSSSKYPIQFIPPHLCDPSCPKWCN